MPRIPRAPITVCIGTYGDRGHWAALVDGRAMPSVENQTLPAANVRWVHAESLQQARNHAVDDTHAPKAGVVASEWLCFLDADDELDPRYLEAMTDAIAGLDEGDWLLQPSTLGVHANGSEDPHPVVIPPQPLLEGNYLIIGTLVKREQFLRLGGFGPWPIYEDWDLWLRCWKDGAAITSVPEAIYRVHVNETGRNSAARATQLRTYGEIRRQHIGGRR